SRDTIEARVNMIESIVDTAAAKMPIMTMTPNSGGTYADASNEGVARSALDRSGNMARADRPQNTDTMVYTSPKHRNINNLRRRAGSESGINKRWLTWGLDRLKKNHGMVRPRNVSKPNVPVPGTLNAFGWFSVMVENRWPIPPILWRTKKTTNVEATIMNNACKASVHMTERMPEIHVNINANAVASTVPEVNEMAPSVMPD